MQHRSHITLAILAAISSVQAGYTCPDGSGSSNMNGVDYCCPGTAIGGLGPAILCDVGFTTIPVTQSDYTKIVYGGGSQPSATPTPEPKPETPTPETPKATPTPTFSHTSFPSLSSTASSRPAGSSQVPSATPSITTKVGTPEMTPSPTGTGNGNGNGNGDNDSGDDNDNDSNTSGDENEDGSSSDNTDDSSSNDDKPGAASRIGSTPALGLAAVVVGALLL